jgi:hypothetical protein
MPIMLQDLIAAAGLYMGWSFICLEINYKRASTMNVPLLCVPVDPMNILWQVFGTHLFKVLDLVRHFFCHALYGICAAIGSSSTKPTPT